MTFASRFLSSLCLVAASFAAGSPLGAAPVDRGASLAPLLAHGDWLGTGAAPASLRGKVVLVDVFTFACIN